MMEYINNLQLSKSTKTTLMKTYKEIESMYDGEIKNISRPDLIQILQQIENNGILPKTTKSMTRRAGNAKSITLRFIHCMNKMVDSKIFSYLKCRKITTDDIIIKNDEQEVIRDYFVNDELVKIENADKTPLEELIVKLFLTTGLRIGGLLNIKIKYVCDGENINKIGYTVEKKCNKKREFMIFDNVKDALNKYLGNGELKKYPDAFLFHKQKHYNIQMTQRKVVSLIKNLCARLDIIGEHVHPHAFRKTVVTRLMQSNDIDKVAKYIGHTKSSTTAKHYWMADPMHLSKEMNIPWFSDMDNPSESSIETITSKQIHMLSSELVKYEKSIYLLDKLKDVLTDEQQKKIKDSWSDDNKKKLTFNIQTSLHNISTAVSTISSYRDSDIL